MTEEEQELGSKRYALRPVCLLRLKSGRIGIVDGFNPRDTIAILEQEKVLDFLLTLEYRERAAPRTAYKIPEPEIDTAALSDLEPFDI